MNNGSPKKNLVPYQKPVSPDKLDDLNGAWITEDSSYTNLEELLEIVEANISSIDDVSYVLHHKALPAEKLKQSVQQHDHNHSALDYIQSKTTKSFIGIRAFREDIADATFFITREKDLFPGKAIRQVGIVETVMLHYGLRKLDDILHERAKVIQARLETIRAGTKEKRRRGTPPNFRWVNLTDTLASQHNVTALDQRDYARLKTIADDYSMSMSFVAQIAMTAAIASSANLPKHIVDSAAEEIVYFGEFLDKYF